MLSWPSGDLGRRSARSRAWLRTLWSVRMPIPARTQCRRRHDLPEGRIPDADTLLQWNSLGGHASVSVFTECSATTLSGPEFPDILNSWNLL